MGCFAVAPTRAAANDMPNSYLAWRLLGPVGMAKLLDFRTSNPPPSTEGGEGDCGRSRSTDVDEALGYSCQATASSLILFGSGSSGLGVKSKRAKAGYDRNYMLTVLGLGQKKQ